MKKFLYIYFKYLKFLFLHKNIDFKWQLDNMFRQLVIVNPTIFITK